MIILFLIGLLAISIGTLIRKKSFHLNIEWLVSYIKQRLEKNKGKKVLFAEIKELLADEIKKEIETSKEMSLSDFDQICGDTPYVSAIYDNMTDTVDDYEGFNPTQIDNECEYRIKENGGLIVVGE